MSLFLGIIFFAIPCGALTATVAGNKGWNGTKCFWAGFFFSLLALIAAAGLPDKKQTRYLRLLLEAKGIDVEKPTEGPSFDRKD